MKYYLLFYLLLITAFTSNGVTSEQQLAEGKQISFERSKGNCLACHVIEDGDTPGNIGPPLINLSVRFSNKQQLREKIWDATVFNPQTSMPPFGKNKILSEKEIDKVVDYLWSLPVVNHLRTNKHKSTLNKY